MADAVSKPFEAPHKPDLMKHDDAASGIARDQLAAFQAAAKAKPEIKLPSLPDSLTFHDPKLYPSDLPSAKASEPKKQPDAGTAKPDAGTAKPDAGTAKPDAPATKSDATEPKSEKPSDPKPGTTPDSAYHAKTEFGKTLEDRYKGRSLTQEQKDTFTKLGDNLYGGNPPADKRDAVLGQFDEQVKGVEAKNFVGDVMKAFPKSFGRELQTVQRDAEKRAAEGGFGADSEKTFIAGEMQAMRSRVGDEGKAAIEAYFKSAGDHVDAATPYADAGLKTAAVASGVAREGAAKSESPLVKALADGLNSKYVKTAEQFAARNAEDLIAAAEAGEKYLAPMVKASWGVEGGIYAAAAGIQAIKGDIAGAAQTGGKGALTIGAGVLGTAACGGPETGVGVACGVVAGKEADDIWDTYAEKGAVSGTGNLIGQGVGFGLSLLDPLHTTRNIRIGAELGERAADITGSVATSIVHTLSPELTDSPWMLP